MSTVLRAEPEDNIAECSASRSRRIEDRGDDYSSEVKIWENETVLDDTFSFHIRTFVSNVRQRDFSKCWPFRRKILERCLSVGVKPFLPPLDPHSKESDYRICDHGLHQLSISAEEKVLCKDDEGQNLNTSDRLNFTAALIETNKAISGEAKDLALETTTLDTSKVVLHTDVDLLDKCCASRLQQEVEIATAELSQGPTPQSSTSICLDSMNKIGCGIETGCNRNVMQSVAVLGDTIDLSENKHATFCDTNGSDIDTVSALQTQRDSNSGGAGLMQTVQQLAESKSNSPSNEYPACEGQGCHLKTLVAVGSPDKLLQDGIQISSERPAVFDYASVACNNAGLQPRLERSIKNGDESSFTGLNLDALVPKVCPVCLNFTSTSNTALNAHIDHCLESVLPGEKGESRSSRHRIKPRKMRSMVDICATAPTRTLEELERSSIVWAFKDETPKVESSCSPTWKRGLVRRQPRTTLHRGLVWKARNGLETDDFPQISTSETLSQIEKFHGEGVVAKQHELAGWIQETDTALKSSKNQVSNLEEVNGALHVASPVKTVKEIIQAKKKKKRDSISTALSKEAAVAAGGFSLLSKEDNEQQVLTSPEVLGFTLIDTSAEEERRLLQKTNCVDAVDTDVGHQESFCPESGNMLGKVLKQQFSKGPPFLYSTSKKLDYRPSSKIAKKRLRTWAENDRFLRDEETSSEEDFEPFSDRSTKTKRCTPKIKSLLTVVANSCKEKESDAFEGFSRQTTTSLYENITSCGIDCPQSGELSCGQETSSKGRYLISTGEDTREGPFELGKRACAFPEKPGFSDDLNVYSLSRHEKSLEQKSIPSGKERFKDKEQYTDKRQQMLHQCSSVECDDRELCKGGFRLYRNTVSTHQADCNRVTGKRANATSVPITESVNVKARHCSTGILDLKLLGVSTGRSEFEPPRNPVTSSTFAEASADNREDAPTMIGNGSEQTRKPHLCVPQCLMSTCSGVSGCPSSSFRNFNSVETNPTCNSHVLSTIQKSFCSEGTTNCQPVNTLRNTPQFHNSQATSNGAKLIVRDDESSKITIASQFFENAQPKGSTIKFSKDYMKPTSVEESFEKFEQSRIKCSVQHGSPQPFGSHDLFEASQLNTIDSRLNGDYGTHFVFNKMDNIQGHHGAPEALQNVSNCTSIPRVSQQPQQINLGPRFLVPDLSPVILSPASEFNQENERAGNFDGNGHYYAPRSAMASERVCLPSRFIADLARSLSTNPTKTQEIPQHWSNNFPDEQNRTLQASYCGASKSMTKGFEYANVRLLQGTGKSCAPSIVNGLMQPQVVHAAVHGLANTSIECMNCVGESSFISQKIQSDMMSGAPFRSGPPRSCMNGTTREGLINAELASSLSNYGTVEYPVDQGVVHIFGSPVFKLMGQNVIVTSNSIAALGSCDQKGAQPFHASGSMRHLGVLPQPHNYYAQNVSPEVLSCTRREAWHGGPLRDRSYMADGVEIPTQAPQNIPASKSALVKISSHKDPSIFKPQMPMCTLEEESQRLRSARELVMKKMALINPGSKLPPEGSINNLPGASSLLPAGLSKRGGITSQQSRRHFISSNCVVPQNEQQSGGSLKSMPVTYLEDIQNLDNSSRYRSGTLADIVRSSERNN